MDSLVAVLMVGICSFPVGVSKTSFVHCYDQLSCSVPADSSCLDCSLHQDGIRNPFLSLLAPLWVVHPFLSHGQTELLEYPLLVAHTLRSEVVDAVAAVPRSAVASPIVVVVFFANVQ